MRRAEDVLAEINGLLTAALDARVEEARAAQRNGLRVAPHPRIDSPTLFVPVETWDALVAKYGEPNN